MFHAYIFCIFVVRLAIDGSAIGPLTVVLRFFVLPLVQLSFSGIYYEVLPVTPFFFFTLVGFLSLL